MAELDLVIFDDAVARDWYPLTLTRPAGELMLGVLTLRERLERVTGARCVGYFAAPELAGFDEANAPRVLDTAASDATRPRLFISSRCVLHWDVDIDTSAAWTLRVGDDVAGWLVPAGRAGPSEDDLLAPSRVRGPEQSLGGKLIDNVWDLIAINLDHVASDVIHFHSLGQLSARPPGNAHVLGDYPLLFGRNVTVEPGVVFDLSAGPVWLDDRVTVHAFSRIAGPMYVGKDTSLLGGVFTASSIGPMCKVHGEVEASVILGYSNKAHDGFLGHAYVGQWVNLGAQTTNSDLKNNYSTVRVATPAGEIDTGLLKLGSLIGDHVKTAIGTMLNTGTVLGTGSNVFANPCPRHVPPFSWGAGEYQLEKFLETAERVMKRRNVDLSAYQRDMLTRVWRSTRPQQE